MFWRYLIMWRLKETFCWKLPSKKGNFKDILFSNFCYRYLVTKNVFWAIYIYRWRWPENVKTNFILFLIHISTTLRLNYFCCRIKNWPRRIVSNKTHLSIAKWDPFTFMFLLLFNMFFISFWIHILVFTNFIVISWMSFLCCPRIRSIFISKYIIICSLFQWYCNFIFVSNNNYIDIL